MTDLHAESHSGGLNGSDDSVLGSDDSDVLALELDQLITDYFDAQREGRAPSVDDYVRQHPEHEHALRAVLPGASLLDQIGKRAEDATPASRSGDRLGEYKLLGVLGRGGMGVVYEAVQESLGRPVALKVLPASRVVDRKSRERFMREAQAAASLQHPGIVPVYGVGEADGQVYYAMQRVDGVPLDVLTAAIRGDSSVSESTALLERAAGLAARLRGGSGTAARSTSTSALHVMDELDGVPSGSRSWIVTVVRVAQQIAEALSYAHSRGVLHRDVKPSNVMLDESGRAYVTDFGLCKTADTSSLTAAGDVVGTLRYVPPERFQGRDDARGDVYGVGMILYELLCSQPAFPQRDRAELVQAVTLHSPARPRRLNPDLPPDLERIVLTAIAKLPEERYPSAEALMEDLGAFLDGRPIRARAPGKLYLARLFARRNRGLVTTVAVSLALIALATAFYVRNLGHLVQEVEAGRARAERVSYAARLNAAMEAAETWHKGISRSKRFLLEIPPGQRDWLWDTVYARSDTAFQIVDHGLDPVVTACLDASETHVATLRESGVRVHRVSDGALLYEAPIAEATALEFIPGTLDLVAVVEGRLAWPAPAGAAPSAMALQVQASCDPLGLIGITDLDTSDHRLAIACRDGSVAVIDAVGGREPRVHRAPEGDAFIALYGGDGRVVHGLRKSRITALGPEVGRVRDVGGSRAREVILLSGSAGSGYFVSLTSSGYTLRYADVEEADVIQSPEVLMRDSGVALATISRDGGTVLTAVRLGRTRIWTEELGAASIRVLGYTARPSALLWPLEGEDIVVAGSSGGWHRLPRPNYVAPNPGVTEFRGHFGHSYEMVVDPSGELLATADGGGAWAVWDLERHLPIAAHSGSEFSLRELALDVRADGQLALATGDAVLAIWTLQRGQSEGGVPVLFEDLPPIRGLGWDGPEPGARLIVGCEDGSIFEFTRAPAEGAALGWTRRLLHQLGGTLTTFEHHRGTGMALAGLEDGGIVFFEGAPSQERPGVPLARLPSAVETLSFGTLGECAVAVSRDQVLSKIDLRGRQRGVRWSKRVAQPGTEELGWTSAAIDEASGWIVTAGADGFVQTWDVEDGLFGPTLEPRFGKYTDTVFPGAGEPPLTLEWRGRVTRFERGGVSTQRLRDSMEATSEEQLALDILGPLRRLEIVEAAANAPGSTRAALELHDQTSRVLEFYARYFPTRLDAERARRAIEALGERLQALDREEEAGPPQ